MKALALPTSPLQAVQLRGGLYDVLNRVDEDDEVPGPVVHLPIGHRPIVPGPGCLFNPFHSHNLRTNAVRWAHGSEPIPRTGRALDPACPESPGDTVFRRVQPGSAPVGAGPVRRGLLAVSGTGGISSASISATARAEPGAARDVGLVRAAGNPDPATFTRLGGYAGGVAHLWWLSSKVLNLTSSVGTLGDPNFCE